MTKLRQFHVCVYTTVLAFYAPAALQAQIFDSPTPQPNANVQQAGGQMSTPQTGEVQQTAWSGIPMPRFTMPKVTMPKMTMPSMASVIAPVKSSFGKVTAGTKKVWEGTKEIFTFGKQKSAMNPARKKPSFWSRLLTPAPEPSGPQTVGEWMSQPRLNP